MAGIGVKNNIDFKKIRSAMFEGAKTQLEKDLVLVKEEIDSRTRKGISADGGSFPAYSPGYAIRKASGAARKKGKKSIRVSNASAKSAASGKPRRSSGKSGGAIVGPNLTVDLTLWGTMLANMKTEVKVLSNMIVGRIYFTSSKQATKAKGHMTGKYFGKSTGKIRKFFALSNEQEAKIRRSLARLYERTKL